MLQVPALTRRNLLLSLLMLWSITLSPTAIGAPETNKPAPEFPAELPWLNVSRPLTLADLRGRVVILDFWTYGCINCVHVAEELKRLEKKFGGDLVVIGVHSPKFDNERRLSTLRNNTLRYDRRHPIVSDVERRMMRLYGARAWPTRIVLDPLGGVEGYVTGEGHEHLLDRTITHLLINTKNRPPTKPLPIALERDRVTSSFLAAPGKIAVHGDKVAISDTLHHRIVIANAAGEVLQTIGTGTAGLQDGSADQARFSAPQGMVFVNDQLYVADTGNHALRRIDLSTGKVSRIAGTGHIGNLTAGDFAAAQVALRSPWDLAWDGTYIYVAMAGSHQIWRYDPARERITAWAGTRREGINDGSISRATFSQPSGLAIFGRDLYIADPEASAIRVIGLSSKTVKTLIGRGLFDFGDKDGSFTEALLQHPLGIATTKDGQIIVADTYNHKLKSIQPKTDSISTLAGSGEPGFEKNGEPQLNEPGGVAILNDKVLIADTNNDRILIYDLQQSTTKIWPLHATSEKDVRQ